MKIEIDDKTYKEFKKVMKAKEIAYIHRNQVTNNSEIEKYELFFKTKLQKLANQLIENEIKKHETHS